MRADMVMVIPCSGIGKPYGTVSREAAYHLVEDLRPHQTRLVALSRLVLGDEIARQQLADAPSVTLDGCKLACASKMVAESGGQVAHACAVLDVYRRHRGLKPKGISRLNPEGIALAEVMAQELALVVDQLTGVRHA